MGSHQRRIKLRLCSFALSVGNPNRACDHHRRRRIIIIRLERSDGFHSCPLQLHHTQPHIKPTVRACTPCLRIDNIISYICQKKRMRENINLRGDKCLSSGVPYPARTFPRLYVLSFCSRSSFALSATSALKNCFKLLRF